MDSLHAPWRIEYILSPKEKVDGGSVFTRIAQSSDDESNLVIARERTCFVLLNRYPYNGGHLMVVPYKNVSELGQLTDEEICDIMRLTRRSIDVLKNVMKPDGFNVGLNLGKVAGAGIEEHLHMHIVPRWNGDTNFMPVLGSTRVVPQALAELATQLRAGFSK